jgi:iron complex outermembrane receptor protein
LGETFVKSRYLISCAFAAIAAGCGHSALAAAAADNSSAPATVEELIVTAQLRSESVQDVPMTIQAFTGKALTTLNVTSLQDLLKYTPNVTYGANGPGQGSVFMRGLSAGQAGNQSSATVGNFPNVAIYLDDQSMQFPGRNVDIYVADMDRVEVLEGPQGTLFGGGAEAGALRYITNKPKFNVEEGKVEASYGFQSHGEQSTAISAMINLPLIQDKLAVRAVFYNDRQGGYIDNVLSTFTRKNLDDNSYFGIKPTGGLCPNGLPAGQTGFCTIPGTNQVTNQSVAKNDQNPVTHQGARLSVAWQVMPDWDVLITQSVQNLDAEGLSMQYPRGSDQQILKPLQVTAFSPVYDKDNFENTAWTVNGKLGDFRLLYTGAYTDRHLKQQNDYTNYSRTLYGQYYECTGGTAGLLGAGPIRCYSPVTSWYDKVQNTHLSNEFRVSTPDTWRLRGVAGAFYERFRVYDVMDFNYKTVPSCREGNNLAAALAGGAPCFGNDQTWPGTTANQPGVRGDLTGFGEDVQRGYDQTAFFADVNYDIIPNVLTVLAGTRYYNYDEFEKGSVYSTNGKCLNTLVCGLNTNIDAENLKVSYHGFKSRAGVQWKPRENTMLYYLYSEGFRPGGFSRSSRLVAKDSSGVAQFKTPIGYSPDNLTNNEVGLKTELFQRRLQVNLSGYYMTWSNTQIALYQPCCLGNTTFLLNGPDYTIRGIEAQFVGRLTEGLTLQGSAAYNENRQANSPCLTGNIAGTTFDGKCITTVKGKPFANPFGVKGGVSAFSPQLQANLRARYDWDVGDLKAFAILGASYTGHMYNQPANYTSGNLASESPVPDTTYLRYRLAPYATLDAQLGFSRNNWSAQIYGQNLLDSHASTFTTSAQFIKAQVPLRPRVVGIKISDSF